MSAEGRENSVYACRQLLQAQNEAKHGIRPMFVYYLFAGVVHALLAIADAIKDATPGVARK